MKRPGIEFLSVFGMPPVEFVHLAADLGCGSISTGLTQIPFNPLAYPEWSLREDPGLRRDMVVAMEERNIRISLGEGFAIRPGMEARDYARDLEIMRELGATRINTVAMEPEPNRCLDQMGELAETASTFGLETTLEFGPGLTIGDLPAALQAVEQVGRRDVRLLIDTMHLVRSGSGPEELRSLDPALVGYVQLCDTSLEQELPDYMEEAMFNRAAPGTGELPLREILEALPRDRVVSLEVPRRERTHSEDDLRTYLGESVAAATELLAAVGR